MSGGGTNMCDVVDIPGVAVKATFCSRVCVGGEEKSEKALEIEVVHPPKVRNCDPQFLEKESIL